MKAPLILGLLIGGGILIGVPLILVTWTIGAPDAEGAGGAPPWLQSVGMSLWLGGLGIATLSLLLSYVAAPCRNWRTVGFFGLWFGLLVPLLVLGPLLQ